MRSMRRSFSLIELLVVVGVIAILCALLLPALAKAKDTAKTISCAANLKQLAQCEFLYTEDNLGWFPSTGGGTNDWSWKLIPYFSPLNTPDLNFGTAAKGSLRLCHCPSQPNPPYWVYFPVSYGQNYYVHLYPIQSNYNGKLSRTSSITLLMDHDTYGETTPTDVYTLSACRHHGHWNSAFLDGHVELIGRDKVVSASTYY